MKDMLTFVVSIILLCAPSLAVPPQNADTGIIDKFIAKQARQDAGEEYENARKLVAGDLNRDGVSDLAVLYTIEGQNGTNNYVQYLAAFVRTRHGLVPMAHTFVGGKWNRDVDLMSIKKNVIHLKTLARQANDPTSTPSKKGKARFMLIRRKLKEL